MNLKQRHDIIFLSKTSFLYLEIWMAQENGVPTQTAITFSKLTLGTLEQGLKNI